MGFAQFYEGIVDAMTRLVGHTGRDLALLKGEVDAAGLDIEDWLVLERQNPGGFHQLFRYYEEFPDVLIGVFAVRREWAESHAEIVKDFVRVYLTAIRRVYQEPNLLREEIGKRLELEPADAEASAQAALDQRIWDANGGLTPQSIETTLGFLVSSGAVPAALTASDVADLSYLNTVLDEIGRQ